MKRVRAPQYFQHALTDAPKKLPRRLPRVPKIAPRCLRVASRSPEDIKLMHEHEMDAPHNAKHDPTCTTLTISVSSSRGGSDKGELPPVVSRVRSFATQKHAMRWCCKGCAGRPGGGGDSGGGGDGDRGDGDAIERWGRIITQLLAELALEALASFAGGMLAFWRVRRGLLRRLRGLPPP